jgi:hypothetical protein
MYILRVLALLLTDFFALPPPEGVATPEEETAAGAFATTDVDVPTSMYCSFLLRFVEGPYGRVVVVAKRDCD